MENVYEMFTRDIINNFDLEPDKAKEIVVWLENEGFADYDFLKEYYLYGDEE